MPDPARGVPLSPVTRDASARVWAVLQDPRTAWVILVVSVALTALAWYFADRAQTALVNETFVSRTTEVDGALVQRMGHYALLLRAGVALFDASTEVTRDEWEAYVRALDLEAHYPGIQGIGFSLLVPREQREAHERELRASGHPDYEVTPAGERDEYHSIMYLEPFDSRNRRAFGFDMHSEPVRRAAMDHARDTGEATVSGVVKLKQETDHDIQKGFLMYLPVFHHGAPRDTPEERREALHGFVYAPFRGSDLMGGILGGKFTDLDYWVFDGPTLDPAKLLFQNHPQAELHADSELSWTSHIRVVGRDWTVHFGSSARRFDDGRARPIMVALAGLLINVLLFAIVRSLSRTKRRAVELANEMTRELRRSLKDKDILLQEVHHRVKNNLQVISSLISLQQRKLDAGVAKDALEECRGRVLAIALIHEKLHRGADAAGVPFADYVRDLAGSVAGASATPVNRVQLELDVRPVELEVEQAIPCGLILQELLSNAFKHAFPNGTCGRVRVALSMQDDNVRLEVCDDGVGFTPQQDPGSASSLGLRLIHMLAEQLEAEIRMNDAQAVMGAAGAYTSVCFARRARHAQAASAV